MRPSSSKATPTRPGPDNTSSGALPGRSRYSPLDPASASMTNSVPLRIDRETLRPSESRGLGRHRAVRGDAIELVARRQRRSRDIERVVGAEGEMKRRDAWRQRREGFRPAALVDAEDRPRAIADKQRAVGVRTRARRPRRDRGRTARPRRRARHGRPCLRTGSTRTGGSAHRSPSTSGSRCPTKTVRACRWGARERSTPAPAARACRCR